MQDAGKEGKGARFQTGFGKLLFSTYQLLPFLLRKKWLIA
jgi:hypothetical protein